MTKPDTRWLIVATLCVAAVAVGAWIAFEPSPQTERSTSAVGPTVAEFAASSPGPEERPDLGSRRPPAAPDRPAPRAHTREQTAGPPPEDGPSAHERAAEFASIYRNWDPGWVGANMRSSAKPEALEQLIDWFRNELGECGAGSPMMERSDSYSRYAYPCENGKLEVGFVVDDEDPTRLKTVQLGARDIEPAPEVRHAAEQALLLLQTWNASAFGATFGPGFTEEETKDYLEKTLAARGACELGASDLANARGALWFIDCESGPALMKTDLDDDDRLRVFFVQDRRPERPGP